MNQLFSVALGAFSVSLLLAFFATSLVIKLAPRLGIMDDPKKNKHPKVIHTRPTPRGGGIPIIIATVVTSSIFLPIDKHLIGILIGASLVAFVGFLDDKYNLNPYLRLFLGFLAAAFPIIAGIGISFVSNPFGGIIDLSQPQVHFSIFGEDRSIWVLSDLLALIFIVGMMNLLNMGAKGVDGQLPGVVVISALTIALLSLKFSADITQWPVLILALILAGAYLGFLPWNYFPQKIMPGYGGSTLAGYMLAILAILSTTKVGTLIVVLGVPLVDTVYTVTRRIISGKSPVWGDRGHLHHRLLDAGFSKRSVSFIYWIFTFFLGVLALSLNTTFKFYTMIAVAVLEGSLLVYLIRKGASKSS